MGTKYPIVLVHGIAIKESRVVKAFGKTGKMLQEAGYTVYSANTDGFGAIETNAQQLKTFVLDVLKKENTEKVNLIAHSKGGLDCKYMILRLDMAEHVSSLTTLSTPHKGSSIASWVYRFPRFFVKFLAFWIDLWYRIFGDKQPDSLKVCTQLCNSPNEFLDGMKELPPELYCQSFSAQMERGRDDFLMSIPFLLSKHCKSGATDGLVSVESAKYAQYRGNLLDETLSHSEMIGYSMKKEKRQRVYAFYLALCAELAEKGF